MVVVVGAVVVVGGRVVVVVRGRRGWWCVDDVLDVVWLVPVTVVGVEFESLRVRASTPSTMAPATTITASTMTTMPRGVPHTDGSPSRRRSRRRSRHLPRRVLPGVVGPPPAVPGTPGSTTHCGAAAAPAAGMAWVGSLTGGMARVGSSDSLMALLDG